MGGETEVLKVVMGLAQITAPLAAGLWPTQLAGPRSPSLGLPDSPECLRLLRTPTPIRLNKY